MCSINKNAIVSLSSLHVCENDAFFLEVACVCSDGWYLIALFVNLFGLRRIDVLLLHCGAVEEKRSFIGREAWEDASNLLRVARLLPG